MDNTILLIAGAIVVVLILLFLLLRGRKQHVDLSAAAPAPKVAAPAPKPIAVPTSAAVPEPVPLADAPAPGVDPGLTRLKGLGPKAAARLSELGVNRIDQIAAWTEADIARIDPEMGAFTGRIARDRWVEQARLLASGDTAVYEAEFGKLGG
jgi:predicted flap endonuclease-1-like 5' DNA nuclease